MAFVSSLVRHQSPNRKRRDTRPGRGAYDSVGRRRDGSRRGGSGGRPAGGDTRGGSHGDDAGGGRADGAPQCRRGPDRPSGSRGRIPPQPGGRGGRAPRRLDRSRDVAAGRPRRGPVRQVPDGARPRGVGRVRAPRRSRDAARQPGGVRRTPLRRRELRRVRRGSRAVFRRCERDGDPVGSRPHPVSHRVLRRAAGRRPRGRRACLQAVSHRNRRVRQRPPDTGVLRLPRGTARRRLRRSRCCAPLARSGTRQCASTRKSTARRRSTIRWW